MTAIHVSASREYDVLIGRGLFERAGEHIRRVSHAQTAAIVAGDIVWPLYGEKLRSSLEAAGFRVCAYLFPHGEQQKTLETYAALLQFLSENRLTRSDVLISLGGGVTGDLGGFAAATYQRGMDFVQIPTTLLAMVDSSVGGKTAVDLPTGKNQVGAFYQPRLVLCDPDVLDTLPEEEFRCGCAEVIKYGVLGNAAFFTELRDTPIRRQLAHVIETCVGMKRDIVCEDEFDTGRRRLLNLGHSFGHAVEACSGYQILHGQAVAIGMAMIARAAAAKGFCSPQTAAQIEEILKRYDLPVECEYSVGEMLQTITIDKKMTGDTMHLVIPEEIGRCRILPVPARELGDWLRLGGAR